MHVEKIFTAPASVYKIILLFSLSPSTKYGVHEGFPASDDGSGKGFVSSDVSCWKVSFQLTQVPKPSPKAESFEAWEGSIVANFKLFPDRKIGSSSGGRQDFIPSADSALFPINRF